METSRPYYLLTPKAYRFWIKNIPGLALSEKDWDSIFEFDNAENEKYMAIAYILSLTEERIEKAIKK